MKTQTVNCAKHGHHAKIPCQLCKHQHTPGPWNVNGSDIYAELPTIARMVDSAIPEDEQEANARLIAACPEMLEMLKAVIDRDDADSLFATPLLKQVREVIAKAEGK